MKEGIAKAASRGKRKRGEENQESGQVFFSVDRGRKWSGFLVVQGGSFFPLKNLT
jgi:hypothetical protein